MHNRHIINDQSKPIDLVFACCDEADIVSNQDED